MIIEIAEFHTTRHGRIDRKCLNNLYDKYKNKNFYILNLRKLLEIEKLLALLQAVLGKGVHENDDFFELGGDSLTALEIILQAEKMVECYFDISTAYIYRKIGEIIREMTKEVGEFEQVFETMNP